MSISNEGSEIEFESDACDSGSKLSGDDSGIEDSWNDENITMKDKVTHGKIVDNDPTATSHEFSFKNFTPLNAQKVENQPYGPVNISPMVGPQLSPGGPVKHDIKDSNAKPGVCGIENLGNTCFINAGLQCLFSTPLLHHLMPAEQCPGLAANADNSRVMLALVEKFQEMFKKVLSGEFKSLYPPEFHNALIEVHAIFGDRKQHDCQEFLSFLLNGLHDALNRINPRKRMPERLDSMPERLDSRESSPPLSNLKLETSSESESDDFETKRDDSPKRMRMDVMDAEPDVGVECDEKLSDAQSAWRSYLQQNHSVIVDVFQGQFKSMVTCEKCRHVSNTYEPFMHVSVPIPFSNERQVVVIWHGLSRMKKLRHVKRYLVTVSKNACIGDVKRALVKMLEKSEEIDEESIIMAEVSKSTITRTLVNHMQLKFLKPKTEKLLYAIETHFNSSNPEKEPRNNAQCCSTTRTSTNNTNPTDDKSQHVSPPDVSDRPSMNRSATGWHTCGICLEDIFDDDLMVHEICGGVLCNDCLQATASYHSGQSFPCPVCNSTVDEKTYQPVSKCDQDQIEERIILVPVFMRCRKKQEEEKEEMPSALREQTETFGHPSVLLLPSKVKASHIRYGIKELLSNNQEYSYSICFTDAQAVSCSRCDTFSNCPGCSFEEDDIQLRPGDHLTINFDDISSQGVESLSSVINDESMSLLRDSDVVQLSECFKFFSESEILTEENPWFCPKCRRNQIATKGISVSRWPDVLIVHLKRFHFEGLRTVKINSPVEFSLNDFSLDFVSSAEIASKENPVYELIGCVCHTGSLTSGHYTSFSRNFLDSKWYHFNDEVASELTPSERDFEKVYMLFYQKTATGNAASAGE